MSRRSWMLARRDPTILIALLVALGVHVTLMGVGVRAARRDLGWWLNAAPPPQVVANNPQPIVAPRPNDPMQQLGDHDTTGTSINRSPGDQPMQSAAADLRQEQAAMQRDPAGFGGKGSNKQLDQLLRGDNGDNRPRGNNSGAQQSASSVFGSRESSLAELTPRAATPMPRGMSGSSNNSGADVAVDPLSRGPQTVAKARQGSAQAPPQTNPATAQQQASNQQTGATASGTASNSGGGVGGKAGAPEPGAGNPIPTSDFESYPVTHIASRFVNGRIEPRSGRKIRTREMPVLGEAGRADLETMENPAVVLLLRIDTQGNVADAKIEHSSGSDNLDFPCVRAAYTWWFEPLKNPQTGEIGPELIEFTIYF